MKSALVARETLGTASILRLSGRLDSQTCAAFEPLIMEGLQNSATVLMDFANVPYISSAGLRIVLKAAKTVQQASGHFALCSLPPDIQRIFEMSGLVRILKVYASPQQAAAELKAL